MFAAKPTILDKKCRDVSSRGSHIYLGGVDITTILTFRRVEDMGHSQLAQVISVTSSEPGKC